jgi:hypothetical protein
MLLVSWRVSNGTSDGHVGPAGFQGLMGIAFPRVCVRVIINPLHSTVDVSD